MSDAETLKSHYLQSSSFYYDTFFVKITYMTTGFTSKKCTSRLILEQFMIHIDHSWFFRFFFLWICMLCLLNVQ